MLNQKGQLAPALEKAKEAQKKEEALRKHREHNGVMDGMNIDLTYSVSFNLANQVAWICFGYRKNLCPL